MKRSKIELGLNMLRSELISCARYIKTWEALALAKDKFENLAYEDFFGSIQIDFMYKLIAISISKINEDTKKYLLKCLDEVFSKEQQMDLLKRSHIDLALKSLKKEYDKTFMREFRNKRIAHIEYSNIPFGVSGKTAANLLEMYRLIAEIEDSVTYILYYVLNPSNLSCNKSKEEMKLSRLDDYFKNTDFFMLDLNKLLTSLNEEALAIQG